jgi:transposase
MKKAALLSTLGIGPVMAAGIVAEIGRIDAFKSQDALAKYAGLVWRENQSGGFTADDTKLSKAGNAYLRYYLIETVSHVKNQCSEFAAFYQKKYDEGRTHQHKRALALTARKFVRLIFGLLAKHQLYSQSRVSQL